MVPPVRRPSLRRGRAAQNRASGAVAEGSERAVQPDFTGNHLVPNLTEPRLLSNSMNPLTGDARSAAILEDE